MGLKIKLFIRWVLFLIRNIFRKKQKPIKLNFKSKGYRSYLRKLYKPILQNVDRRVNSGERDLLSIRRLLVARRRREILPDSYLE